MPGKSRACGEQVAHRVFFFPVSRTHAVVSGCAPSPGFCWPGLAPAVGKTRTVSFSSPCLARTRLFPGVHPRPASVGRGSHLRRASRAPCLCLCSASHARGCFRVRALARLLLAGARTCGEQDAHPVCAPFPASHARGWFRVRARTRLLLAGARGCAGQIARASVYLRLLYQKGRVKSKRMDEFFRTFIRSLSRLCCGGRKRGASARAKRREKRRMRDVRNGGAQGITASGGEILTRTKPNRERMNNR